MATTEQCNVGTADRLPNGANIISRWYHAQRDRWIVLACWQKGNSRWEYITWATDDCGNAYWGHYFNTYQQALEDFNKRSQEGI